MAAIPFGNSGISSPISSEIQLFIYLFTEMEHQYSTGTCGFRSSFDDRDHRYGVAACSRSIRVGAQYHHCRVSTWLHWVVYTSASRQRWYSQIVILLCTHLLMAYDMACPLCHPCKYSQLHDHLLSSLDCVSR